MKFIQLTSYPDGLPLSINTDDIQSVAEYPVGQCEITYATGVVQQVEETVEQVTAMLEDA